MQSLVLLLAYLSSASALVVNAGGRIMRSAGPAIRAPAPAMNLDIPLRQASQISTLVAEDINIDPTTLAAMVGGLAFPLLVVAIVVTYVNTRK